MCGIAGYLGPRRADLERISECLGRSLAHRGPDHKGAVVLNVPGKPDWILLLVHRRLSILDLSPAGNQPMEDPEAGNWIVYNGEVYNFRSLAQPLERSGVRFRSKTDTEVILKGYAAVGSEILDSLCGMFAFALWDGGRGKLLLAVDPLGIKPLYHCRPEGGGFLFASEIRAILNTALVKPAMDPVGLEGYLSYGAVQAPNTIIRGIRALLPGTFLVVPAGGEPETPRSYWTSPFEPCLGQSGAGNGRTAGREMLEELRNLLEVVVEEHLVSDVPVGAFLSGGIDSSAVVALANCRTRDLRTFSVVFAEEAFSEGEYSREVARLYSPRHTEICLSEGDLLGMLPDGLAAMDQPTLDGINVYAISRAVRATGVKVVLSGQGGDEVFGGYSTFRTASMASRWDRRLAWIPPLGWKIAGAAWRAVKDRRRVIPSKIGQILGSDRSTFRIYLLLRQLFPASVRREIFPSGGPGTSPEGLPVEEAASLARSAAPLDPVNQVSFLELRTYLANMLLRDGDFMSMAHSLEVRVPFLDRRIVQMIGRLPGDCKLDRVLPKPLLLKALAGKIPEAVYRRKKQGFTFPWEKWLHRQLLVLATDALGDDRTYRGMGMDPHRIRYLWDRFLSGQPEVTWSRIWSLIVLREWALRHGAYLEENPPAGDAPTLAGVRVP